MATSTKARQWTSLDDDKLHAEVQAVLSQVDYYTYGGKTYSLIPHNIQRNSRGVLKASGWWVLEGEFGMPEPRPTSMNQAERFPEYRGSIGTYVAFPGHKGGKFYGASANVGHSLFETTSIGLAVTEVVEGYKPKAVRKFKVGSDGFKYDRFGVDTCQRCGSQDIDSQYTNSETRMGGYVASVCRNCGAYESHYEGA